MNLRGEHDNAQLVSMVLSDAIAPFMNNEVPFSTYDRESTVIDGCLIMGVI
jgi:hypothetical protein